MKIYFAPVQFAEKARQSQAFSEVKGTKTRAVGEGFSLGLTGFEGGLRLSSNHKCSRTKVGFYFWSITWTIKK
ncbi:MAG: hypothetical protein LBJ59_08715 [Zoogloeaceae bacterium]|nr:hypothetical protein [Zoogloeaceae bacterium]